MADGYVHIINAFYWRGDDKTMFSPTLEMTTIQDGGAIVRDFSFFYGRHSLILGEKKTNWKIRDRT